VSPAIRTSVANITPTKTPQFQAKGWCFYIGWGGTTINGGFGGLGGTGFWLCF
jgi:hypothetical protein